MAAALCMAAADERERAVAEVAQVYERIKIQQFQCPSNHQLAQSLLSDALRALNVALSVMKQQQPALPAASPVANAVVKAEPLGLSPPTSPASADSQAIATTERRAKKRSRSSLVMEGNKTSSSSWVNFTTVPCEDGYEWRKYGEKKINGTSYTRSYFRCTYKDERGCLATKHVQQKDRSSDPPVFQVTYNNKHTCNNTCTATTAAANTSERLTINNSPPLINGHHHASMGTSIKQEPPAVLPPPAIVEAAYYSALCPFDQTPPPPCQQDPSFPATSSMQQQQQPCGGTATSSTTSSSCISGESCDDYHPAGDIMAAAAEASPGYDLLYEELSLLCDSFKVY
ncbi:unnamed protein product [Urochloa humidicola]